MTPEMNSTLRISADRLPGGFDDAGNFAGERELTEGDTRYAELAVICARAAAQRAAVTDAGRRRVARKLLQLLLHRVELFVRRRWIYEGGLQFGTLGGKLGRELDALLVALDGGGLGHGRRSMIYDL